MIMAILVGLVAVAVHPPNAAAQADFYGEGNRLYQEGDFAGALEAYTSILDAGFGGWTAPASAFRRHNH